MSGMQKRWVALAGVAGAALAIRLGPGLLKRLRGRDEADETLAGSWSADTGTASPTAASRGASGPVDYEWIPSGQPVEVRGTLQERVVGEAPRSHGDGGIRLGTDNATTPMGAGLSASAPLAREPAVGESNPPDQAPTSPILSPTAPVNAPASLRDEKVARRLSERVVHFPDRHVGTLYISESPEHSVLGYAWDELGEARGAVTVPAGKLLRLDVSKGMARDLGWLAAVGPDDPHTLNFPQDPVTDDELVNLEGLTGLRQLDLSDTPITDAALAHIGRLTKLESLNLSGTAITDAGLQYLAGLRDLEILHLYGTGVTDAGVRHLAGLGSLRDLRLGATGLTDAGLEHIGRLSTLEELDVRESKVTNAGLGHLSGLSRLRRLVHHGTGINEAEANRLTAGRDARS